MSGSLSDAVFNNSMACCSVTFLAFLAGFFLVFLRTLLGAAWSSFVADPVFLRVGPREGEGDFWDLVFMIGVVMEL